MCFVDAAHLFHFTWNQLFCSFTVQTGMKARYENTPILSDHTMLYG